MSTPRSSEAHFQRQVEQLAKFYGWRVYHAPDNRPSGKTGRVQRVTPGFPDLVLVRGPELVFAELKTEKGRVKPEQHEWVAALDVVSSAVRAYTGNHEVPGALAVDVFIWRPADFDEMHARLARGRARVEPLYRADAGEAA